MSQSKKPVVKELERQANGTFVAAPIAPEPVPSPRTFRANRAKALETKDTLEAKQDKVIELDKTSELLHISLYQKRFIKDTHFVISTFQEYLDTCDDTDYAKKTGQNADKGRKRIIS